MKVSERVRSRDTDHDVGDDVVFLAPNGWHFGKVKQLDFDRTSRGEIMHLVVVHGTGAFVVPQSGLSKATSAQFVRTVGSA